LHVDVYQIPLDQIALAIATLALLNLADYNS
jgi:hypothetical protein